MNSTHVKLNVWEHRRKYKYTVWIMTIWTSKSSDNSAFQHSSLTMDSGGRNALKIFKYKKLLNDIVKEVQKYI
jgi:hypothetical protein